MEISANTKINDLLKKYPFLLDFFIAQSPAFKKLKHASLRKTVGKVATLKMAASIGQVDLGLLISGIARAVEAETGESLTVLETASEPAPDDKERQVLLKGIIEDLQKGEGIEVLKTRFKKVLGNVDASEIAKAEQQLIDDGLPPEELKRLCDVHVEVFKDALEAQDRPEPPPGHPLHTYMKENRASEKIMSDIQILIGRLGLPPDATNFTRHRDDLGGLIDRLAEIDTHYTRKENQLFPLLESHHFTGPSQVMWAIHDDIRTEIKKAKQQFAASDPGGTATALKEAVSMIRDMVFKEEHILFPASLDMLSESEWVKAKEGEADIGYAWDKPDTGWPEVITEKVEPLQRDAPVSAAGVMGLDTGALMHDQINLLLTNLQSDLTYVDENDRVAYYVTG